MSRRTGDGPLGVRLLLDCSVVLFSFPEGGDGHDFGFAMQQYVRSLISSPQQLH